MRAQGKTPPYLWKPDLCRSRLAGDCDATFSVATSCERGLAESEMNESLYNYDPASALEDPESIAIFMVDAFETGDSVYVSQALGVVARSKGIAHLSQESGTDDLSFLSRP